MFKLFIMALQVGILIVIGLLGIGYGLYILHPGLAWIAGGICVLGLSLYLEDKYL